MTTVIEATTAESTTVNSIAPRPAASLPEGWGHWSIPVSGPMTEKEDRWYGRLERTINAFLWLAQKTRLISDYAIESDRSLHPVYDCWRENGGRFTKLGRLMVIVTPRGWKQ